MSTTANTDPEHDENRHVNQNPPIEWHAIEYDGQTLVVRDIPEGTASLFGVIGRSRHVRRLAQADAVIFDGCITNPFHDEDTGCVAFTHDYAATLEEYVLDAVLDDPAIILESTRSGSGDLLEASDE